MSRRARARAAARREALGSVDPEREREIQDAVIEAWRDPEHVRTDVEALKLMFGGRDRATLAPPPNWRHRDTEAARADWAVVDALKAELAATPQARHEDRHRLQRAIRDAETQISLIEYEDWVVNRRGVDLP